MVKHIILWRLREDLTAEEKESVKQDIKAGLEGLAGRVPGLLSITVNVDGRLESSNADVMLDSTFTDEAALKAWFDTHKKNYAWKEPRYKGIAYHVKTKQDVKAVKNCVKKLPFDQWAEALRTTFNPDSIIRIRVEKGIFKPGDNATIDKMVFKQAAQAEVNPDYPIDAVFGKKVKRPDDYNDVRPQVVEDLQDYLEQEWVADLRRRYQVEVNKEVLKTVNKHL